jgi:hypothetical membrane protein
MLLYDGKNTALSIPGTLRLIGIIGGTLGLLVTFFATLAYIPEHPDFSLFTTYLSDIGDALGWPQIIFNSGTLIVAPIRYIIIVLLVLRLLQLGAGRAFAISVLLIGAVSTMGTVFMTAVPFSVAPEVHKSGIGLYFFGVVILQSVIGFREWSLKTVPRFLPGMCFSLVVVFSVFAVLITLHQQGVVSRDTPVIWEWLCFFISIAWVFAHSLMLGRDR